MNVRIDVAEARAVSGFTRVAMQQLRENEDPTLLLILINAWSLVSLPEDQRIFGKKMLDLLNQAKVRDPLIAREVLHFVGTPLCKCPAVDAWKAVEVFLGSDHLLSVNVAALAAALRLLESAQPTGADILNRCLANALRLRESPSPEARDLASALMAYA